MAVTLAVRAETPEKFAADQARAEIKRNADFQRLVGIERLAAAKLRAFIAKWAGDCRGQSQTLERDPQGQLGCAMPPAAATLQPHAPQPPIARPPETPPE